MLTRKERAKIFMPFDALSGFKEALHKKEIELEERKELFEEENLSLQEEFNKIDIGCFLEIMYYENRRYVSLVAEVENIDTTRKKFKFSNGKIINFCDIIKMKKLDWMYSIFWFFRKVILQK